MRVLCMGLDGRASSSGVSGSAVSWTREISRHVAEYVVIAESRHGLATGLLQLAPNAFAHVLSGHAISFPFAAAALAQRLHAEQPFDLCSAQDPTRAGLAAALFSMRTGVPLNIQLGPAELPSSVHQCFSGRIAAWVANHADSIRCYGPEQITDLQRLGIPADRLFCIPPPSSSSSGEDSVTGRCSLGCVAREVASMFRETVQRAEIEAALRVGARFSHEAKRTA